MRHMVSILLASYVNVITDVCDNSEQAGQAVLTHILSIYLSEYHISQNRGFGLHFFFKIFDQPLKRNVLKRGRPLFLHQSLV